MRGKRLLLRTSDKLESYYYGRRRADPIKVVDFKNIKNAIDKVRKENKYINKSQVKDLVNCMTSSKETVLYQEYNMVYFFIDKKRKRMKLVTSFTG